MSDAALWQRLRQLTAARIGLARSGASVATCDHLAFREAHALARDAVHSRLDPEALAVGLRALGLEAVQLECACPDEASFLTRPDLGRRLAEGSRGRLVAPAGGCDIAFALVGGLSPQGVAAHAVPLLEAVLPGLRQRGWRIGPVAVLARGRVALGDEIGAALGAGIVVVLIGERPGLSSPDSMGAYVTWQPRPGRSDAERNCLSNIRPAGMPIAQAATRLLWLLQRARALEATGVALKDDSDAAVIEAAPSVAAKWIEESL